MLTLALLGYLVWLDVQAAATEICLRALGVTTPATSPYLRFRAE